MAFVINTQGRPSLGEALGTGISTGMQQSMQQKSQLKQALALESAKQNMKKQRMQEMLQGIQQAKSPQNEQQVAGMQGSNGMQQPQTQGLNEQQIAAIASEYPQMATILQRQEQERTKSNLAQQKMALSETKGMRNKIREEADSSRRMLKSIENQQHIIDKGLKTGPLSWNSIMHKMGMIGASSPEAQAFQANILNYMEGQRTKFGIRLTDADLKIINDKMPELAKSKEGNQLILSLFRAEAKDNLLRKEAMNNIVKKGITLNFEEEFENEYNQLLSQHPEQESEFKNLLENLHSATPKELISNKTKSTQNIRMRDPSGKLREISKEDVKKAQEAGYKLEK